MANALAYNGKLLVDQNGHIFKYDANTGNVNITSNGTHSVDGKAYAIVNVKGGVIYVFEVVNGDTGAPVSGANIRITHNGTLLTTVSTNSSGIASYESKYIGIEYTVTYSTWPSISGIVTVTEVGTISTNIAMTDPMPSSHTPGDVITWDGKEWLVCHYDSGTNRVYLISKDIISMTPYGLSEATYSGSTLASVAANYQANNMSAAALDLCVDVTVSGVTAKVFVPDQEQFEGDFSWFRNYSSRRIANYQGKATDYWDSHVTKSGNTMYCGYVTKNGAVGIIDYISSISLGFRPCVCVQL